MYNFVIHPMDSGLTESVDDISSERMEILEKNLGKWWDELWLSGFALAFVLVQLTALTYTLGLTRRRYFIDAISNDSSDFSSRFFINSLFFNSVFLLALVILSVVLFLINRKRYYIVFNLRSDSTEEPEFSLSSFPPLFSRENIATRIKSINHSFSSMELGVPSDSDEGLLLDKFRIKLSEKIDRSIGLDYHIFIIAFDENDNPNNTFIFYSRHESTWRKILAYLEDNGCTVEVQHRQEIRR